MPKADDKPVDEPVEAAPKEKKRRLRHFPVKSFLALVIIVLVGLPIFSTLQPRYYERYPDLEPRMENWRASTHAKIPCSGCHVYSGAGGMLEFSARAIPAFYSQLIQGPHPDNLLDVPDSDACQKCHTAYRQVSSTGDLLIPHRAHVEILEVECATCHRDLVHSENTQGYNSPKMTMCFEQCHDGESATRECIKCHTRKHVPDNHKTEDWLEVHSQRAEEIDCGECHAWSPDFCAECHSEKPESHAGNWKKMHQFPALERGDKGCKTCHEEKFCLECHD